MLTPLYPNPDPSPGTVYLPYALSIPATVSIRIYDVSGEVVRDLQPFAGSAGANQEVWDGRNSSGAQAASGVFIAHVTARAGGQSRDAWMKLAIVR